MTIPKTAAELLPCPFCGPGQSMVDPWYDDVSKRWAVGCGRCGSSSGRSIHAEGSKEAAIKSWNTRAPAQCDVQTEDVRWGVNVLLETIAQKFEAWDTYDLWRSDAAATVRGFKHAAPSVSSADRAIEQFDQLGRDMNAVHPRKHLDDLVDGPAVSSTHRGSE